MTFILVHNISTNHFKDDINQNFKNMLNKGRRDLTKYFNCVLFIITQCYNFVKLQNYLKQNDFVNKLAISANETFRCKIHFKTKQNKNHICLNEKLTLFSLEYSTFWVEFENLYKLYSILTFLSQTP